MGHALRNSLVGGLLLLASAGVAAGKGRTPWRPLAAREPPHASSSSPDGRRLAEVRGRALGGEGVWVSGRLVWPPADTSLCPLVTGAPVWSRRGDAVAFLARDPAGAVTLVVALVEGEGAPTTLSWPIPAMAEASVVVWLGERRVAVGPGELEPKVVASWKSLR